MSEERGLVLVVEDEPTISDLERLYLGGAGFGVHVESDGRSALDAIARLRPAAIVLDIGVPGLDGIELCRTLRGRGDWTPVVFVTARDDEVDRIVGLELGADDYVTKPFNPLEVVARVKAVLRRTQGRSGETPLRVGLVEVDPAAHAAVVDGASGRMRLELTATEFRILAHMARSPTRAFTRAELIDACMPEGNTLERTIDTHASNIRRKLQAAGAEGFFEGVRGVGYRLAQVP